MHDAHEFLKSLTIVLGVAAVTTVVFQRLRQPVVLGYIIAGLIVGPHVPIPLVADPVVVQTLSELGVILLMFSLGLEFSLRRLAEVGPTAGLTALLETSFMIWLGFTIGRLLGWTGLESLFAGAVIAISSTTIIAQAFEEQGVTGKLRQLVLGILIAEDLIAVLLIAVLTGVASGSGLAPGPLAATVARLVGFLVALITVGLLLVPRAMRAVSRLNRRQTTLVASIGICFAVALLAQAFGYSVALGAFLAGSLVAESGEEKQVAHLVEPVRDVFAAVFFVSVGMLIDPRLVARHWQGAVALTGAVVLGKVTGVSLGAFLTGRGMRTSIQAGLSLAQIGEFSFIIAGLGLALHATGDFLYPVAITVSAVTTLLTPWMIRASDSIAAWVDRKLPRPLQTFAALYTSWLEELRARRPANTALARVRPLLRLLVLDAALIASIVVATSASIRKIVAVAQNDLAMSELVARSLVIGTALALCAPFCLGVVRVSQKLGVTLARLALPTEQRKRVDFAAAPRRMLVVTFQLAAVLLVGTPLLALTQPFLPGVPAAALLGLLVAVLGVAFWRSATNLQGHVRAGAQVILEALTAQARPRGASAESDTLEHLHQLLPGLGALAAARLDPSSAAVGKTLAHLNLRGRTGATVLAVTRAEGGVIIPTADEVLRAGDVLALAGSRDAIEAARTILLSLLLSIAPLALAAQLPADSGAALYRSWCLKCHGADGRGTPATTARLEVPPADLADCKASTAEPDDRWVGIVTKGAAAFGLSLDMPAFGEAGTPEQIRAVIRYVRSLCRERGWPPGELNFPRAFLVEKAYPENEWVVTERGAGQELIYERRLGKRLQLEAAARTAFDSLDRPFDGVTAAAKYNVWHSSERRALVSLGLEATPPLGRQEAWEVEPFLAFGANPRRTLFVQGEVVGTWEEAEGITALSYRLGLGRAVGRVVPMLEAGWTVPTEGERTLSLYPQAWVQLSRLGHVAASLGAELPAVGPEPRHPRLIAFVLWDYADAPLFRGW